MIKYISSREFNTIFELSIKENAYRDDFSRKLAIRLLENRNKTEDLVITEQDQLSYSDLLLTYYKENFQYRSAVEVKYRFKDLNITNYTDHIIEINKYNSFINNKNNGNIDNGYLISIFSQNGEIWVSCIFTDKINIDNRIQNETTMSNTSTDGNKIQKTDVFFKPTTKIYYCFMIDTETNTLCPIFEDSPIDISEKNKQLNSSTSLF